MQLGIEKANNSTVDNVGEGDRYLLIWKLLLVTSIRFYFSVVSDHNPRIKSFPSYILFNILMSMAIFHSTSNLQVLPRVPKFFTVSRHKNYS